MIDTIYFDNWNTLVTAPELMKKGSSTRRARIKNITEFPSALRSLF